MHKPQMHSSVVAAENILEEPSTSPDGGREREENGELTRQKERWWEVRRERKMRTRCGENDTSTY